MEKRFYDDEGNGFSLPFFCWQMKPQDWNKEAG